MHGKRLQSARHEAASKRRSISPADSGGTMSRTETALIVGAGKGLSASLARLFAAEGMQVALAARDTSKLTELVDETGALPVACDASQPDQVTALFERVEKAFGAPDLVVYN